MHVGIETSGSNRNNKRSFKYNKTVVTCPPLVIRIISLFCLKAIASGSMERSKGEGTVDIPLKIQRYVCMCVCTRMRVCLCVCVWVLSCMVVCFSLLCLSSTLQMAIWLSAWMSHYVSLYCSLCKLKVPYVSISLLPISNEKGNHINKVVTNCYSYC